MPLFRLKKMNRFLARSTNFLLARRFNQYTHNYDEIVNNNKIVVFMKGTPEQPQVRYF